MAILGGADERTRKGVFCKLYVFEVSHKKNLEKEGTQNLEKKAVPLAESLLCTWPCSSLNPSDCGSLSITSSGHSPDFPREDSSSLHVLIAPSVWLRHLCKYLITVGLRQQCKPHGGQGHT